MSKKIVYILLNIVAYALGVINVFIPIHGYKWTQDTYMSNLIDSDAVLVVLIFSITSIVCATIAYLLKTKSKTSLILYSIIMGLDIYEIVQLISINNT